MPYIHPSLQRRKRVNPFNAEKRARQFARAYLSTEYVAFVKRFGCMIPGCGARQIDAAHVRGKAAGGRWTDLVGLCRDHHREQHALGQHTFASKYGIAEVLPEFARYLAARWIAEAEAVTDEPAVLGAEPAFPPGEDL